jgi:hypothetical protein
MTSKLRFKLTLEGVVDLNGMSEEEGTALLQSNLDEIMPRATGDAWITGYTQLTLGNYGTELEIEPVEGDDDEEEGSHDD